VLVHNSDCAEAPRRGRGYTYCDRLAAHLENGEVDISPMSLKRILTGGALFGGALSFVRVMRELDLAAIEQQLQAPVRILVTATEAADAHRLAIELFGEEALSTWLVAVSSLSGATKSEDRPDLVLIGVRATEEPLELVREYRGQSERETIPVVAVGLEDGAWTDERKRLDAPTHFRFVASKPGSSQNRDLLLAGALVDLLADQSLAVGRRFPMLRAGIAERLIRQTSRANAQFALVSSLPASLPLVGGLVGDAADLIVLTKNQAVLVYKLAGLYGRDVHDRVALALEIAPVVGGAFLWRTVARSLFGLLPSLIGGIPKVMVAYAGTYTVGQIARYYYSIGRRPSSAQLKRFQAEGARLAMELAARLRSLKEQPPKE
jgi:uncharacterized protein (DUF697 family)